MIRAKFLFLFILGRLSRRTAAAFLPWGLLLPLLWPRYSAASDLSWKVGSELGYYHSSIGFNRQKEHLLGRFTGALRYKGSHAKSSWNFEAQLKPELYDFNGNTGIIKSSGGLQFIQKYSRGNWTLALDFRNNKYYLDNIDITFRTVGFRAGMVQQIRPSIFLLINGGYLYRYITDGDPAGLDALPVRLKIVRGLSPYLVLSGGMYLERFRLHQTLTLNQVWKKEYNRGWRYGPEFSVEYQRDFYFNFVYSIFGHASDVTVSPSTEQSVRLVLGKILSPEWSAFLLIDYYFNQLKGKGNPDPRLYYSAINNENFVQFKLEKDLSASADLYFKVVYLNEDLIIRNYGFDGWQTTCGLEFEF